MVAEIMELIEKLRKTEKELMEKKEALRNKEDSLILHTNWANLKETKGISNEKQRTAHIRELTLNDREETLNLEIERDYLRRVFQVLLQERNHRLNDKVENLQSEINLLRLEAGAY